jgi:6-phosphofructokinase 1
VDFEVVPLRNVAKETRHVPDEFINKAGNNVTQAFIDYSRPLVGALPKCERFAQLKCK